MATILRQVIFPVARPPAPVERPVTLRLNGSDLVTVPVTPVALDDWAVGFLLTEGLIDGPGAISSVEFRADPPAVCVAAALSPRWDPELARRRYLTSGCGKGVTFSSIGDAMALVPLSHPLQLEPGRLARFQAAAREGAVLYRQTGGVHAAAVAHTGTDAVLVREDIGRHNAVDKALGAALRQGWDLRRCVLVTSGRISYEICVKLARAGVAVGASRTAATDQAVRLAQRLGLALAGYLRPERMVLYCDPAGRIAAPAAAVAGR